MLTCIHSSISLGLQITKYLLYNKLSLTFSCGSVYSIGLYIRSKLGSNTELKTKYLNRVIEKMEIVGIEIVKLILVGLHLKQLEEIKY